MVLQRFAVDDWVPRKLEIEVKVPDGSSLDFEVFRAANNGQPVLGEEAFPEEATAEESGEPELDQGLLNQVLQMGIPENPAKHALHATGNNNADAAVGWYFENMDKPEI